MEQKRADLTFNINKLENFPGWYEEILQLAEIVDKRTNIKGITVMPPYGCFMHYSIMRLVEDEWTKQGIQLAQFPTVIPETMVFFFFTFFIYLVI
jgi:prolyl-tRNA synthetase